MKKVRCVFGMLGAAVPALGVLGTAANAAAVTHPTAKPSTKAVSLQYGASAAAALDCRWVDSVAAYTGAGANRFKGVAGFGAANGVDGSHCVYGTKGVLSHSQTGLEMRSQIYDGATREHQQYVHGYISPLFGTTSFWVSHLNVYGTKACEELVYSTDTGRAAYPQACEPVP
jgi:hypothetical protein